MYSLLVLIFTAIASTNAEWSMTLDEFQKCSAVYHFGTPSENIYKAFVSQAESKGNISSKLEAFMAVSEMSWESWGFTARSESACSNGNWAEWPCDSYDTKGCPAGKKYYGRGFLQITHCYNYKAAAVDFPGIVENPDSVATDDRLAMGTALWFWKNHIHNAEGVQHGAYGAATNALDGFYECSPKGNTDLGRQRWRRFNECLQAANYTEVKPTEDGCYTGKTPDIPYENLKPNNTKTCRDLGDHRFDVWCVQNCSHGNCPSTVCKCD